MLGNPPSNCAVNTTANRSPSYISLSQGTTPCPYISVFNLLLGADNWEKYTMFTIKLQGFFDNTNQMTEMPGLEVRVYMTKRHATGIMLMMVSLLLPMQAKGRLNHANTKG